MLKAPIRRHTDGMLRLMKETDIRKAAGSNGVSGQILMKCAGFQRRKWRRIGRYTRVLIRKTQITIDQSPQLVWYVNYEKKNHKDKRVSF